MPCQKNKKVILSKDRRKTELRGQGSTQMTFSLRTLFPCSNPGNIVISKHTKYLFFRSFRFIFNTTKFWIVFGKTLVKWIGWGRLYFGGVLSFCGGSFLEKIAHEESNHYQVWQKWKNFKTCRFCLFCLNIYFLCSQVPA